MIDLDNMELDLLSTNEEFSIMTSYLDIMDNWSSLEEARIILGHSPCYPRRGYAKSFGKRNNINVNVFDEDLDLLEQSEHIVTKFENNLDDILEVFSKTLLDDPKVFKANLRSIIETKLGE